jgi:deoxyribonuclease-4
VEKCFYTELHGCLVKNKTFERLDQRQKDHVGLLFYEVFLVRSIKRDGRAQLVKEAPEGATFLIENAASPNGKIGGKLDEIQWLIEEIDSNKLGWCFDTCHAFTAGYGLGKTQPEGSQLPRTAEAEIERLGLWESLKCVHVNDSRDPFGSGRDRHDNLNDGLIPRKNIEYFLNLPKLAHAPLILEVPGIEKEGPDAENIKRLKTLVHMD